MNKKIFIVDDSLVVRRFMTKMVGEFPGYEVVGTASNGATGVAMLAGLDPDMVILDIEMPVMDGLTALPKMLAIKPGLKVIVFSSLTKRNADISIKALKFGAYDYVHKPSSLVGGDDFLEEYKGILKTKLDAAFVVKNIAKNRDEIKSTNFPPIPSRISPKVLLIGSSTGGPQAVLLLLSALNALNVNLPILISQHMPPVFTLSFAKQIQKETGYTTVEAEPDMVLKSGMVYVAPGDFHMVPDSRISEKINLTQTDKVNYCRPSVDVMFEAYAKAYGPGEIIALILTGMGKDGVNGAKKIIEKSGVVFVQDEETSVVWGMPGAAVAAKACQAVFPIGKLGQSVSSILNQNKTVERRLDKAVGSI